LCLIETRGREIQPARRSSYRRPETREKANSIALEKPSKSKVVCIQKGLPKNVVSQLELEDLRQELNRWFREFETITEYRLEIKERIRQGATIESGKETWNHERGNVEGVQIC
jgi:hypothetical protein